MKLIALCLIASFFLLISGCVSTKVSSLVDPDYRNVSFKRVLVIGNFTDIDIMKQFETYTVNRLQEKGLYAIANYQLLPPIRQYTDAEKRNAFVREKLDCYLIISPTGVNSSTVYVPSISSTSASVKAQQNQAQGSWTTVTNEGGARDIVSSIDSQSELFDFQNGRIVWKGDATSNIPHYGAAPMAQPDQVFQSNCEEIVDQLIKDGVLSRTK